MSSMAFGINGVSTACLLMIDILDRKKNLSSYGLLLFIKKETIEVREFYD
jgi:hypothetical protein